VNRECWVVDLDVLDYAAASDLQARLVEARVRDEVPDLLLLVEHPPAITLGRSARQENVLVSTPELSAQGVTVHETNRGGDVTYHGPGQLVGYPILRLTGEGRDIHAYLRSLEALLIAAVADFGVSACRVRGLTGVWAEDTGGVPEESGAAAQKIAAIGVAIRHWVTMHGFALNVAPNLDHFRLIRPCGIADRGVTSLAKLLGEAPVKLAVRGSVVRAFGAEFGLTPRWVSSERLLARIET
jgi:lipoate-protein ligase B